MIFETAAALQILMSPSIQTEPSYTCQYTTACNRCTSCGLDCDECLEENSLREQGNHAKKDDEPCQPPDNDDIFDIYGEEDDRGSGRNEDEI